jgi:hypothetical protein
MDCVKCVAARILCDGERHWLKQLDCWQCLKLVLTFERGPMSTFEAAGLEAGTFAPKLDLAMSDFSDVCTIYENKRWLLTSHPRFMIPHSVYH